MVHARVLAALQRELQNKYVVSSSIRHKGERGRSREHGVANFLRENLPSAYGVATGELFSFSGEGVSPQCDVIIYDELRSPIFGRGAAVQQVPIEGSFVVVEVRSIIDAGALGDTRKKFNAIRQLWEASCENGSGNNVDDGPHLFLFGFKKSASTAACLSFAGAGRPGDCSIVSLDSGCSIWVQPDDPTAELSPHWLDATVPDADYYATLAFFYFELLSCCQPTRAPLNHVKILLAT